MKKIVAHIILIICCTALSQAQESTGAIALDLPARNSLMFNKYILSPALSYAREDYRHITINNKREFFQIEDAPETYLASFSGRFSEKIGGGVGLFQRNFGVFTTFGGIVNFAYNAQLAPESNLTFGLNLLVYNSSINMDRIVTTVTDPLINNLPSSLITTISPGINYGGGFIDVGLTINNLVSYDVSTSQILKEQTQRGIQGHLMYSGYIDSYGFFDNSKFSVLGRAEFQEETSIYSGLVMLRVPKGFWIQGGYNTLYGGSAGAGFNITSKIALEYNYEKSLGNFLDLGSSHELTLAFILPTQDASSFKQERITGLLNFEKKRKSSYSRRSRLARNKIKESAKPVESTLPSNDVESEVAESTSGQQIKEQKQAIVEEKASVEAENKARIDAETAAKKADEEQARLAAAEQARLEAEEQARLEAKAIAREAAEEQARLAATEQARLEAEEQARIEAEAIAREAAEEQARLAAAEQARLEAEEQARIEAEAIAREAAAEQARLAALEQARLEAEEQARIEAEAIAKEAAAEQARLAALEQARLEAEEQARIEAKAIAREAAAEQARLAALEQARLEAEEQARIEAEAIAREAAAEQARLAALEQAGLEAEEQARIEAEAIAKEAAEEQARLAATEIEKGDIEEKMDIPTPNDELGRSLQILTTQTEALQSSQSTLLESLTIAINSKDSDLKALKNENDLSEQGIFVEPRPFKSVSQENAKIESLKLELDETLKKQNKKIEELEDLYIQRTKKVRGNDEINQYFRDAITSLKKQREETKNAKVSAISLLESIKIATQFERSRRIKRAAFNDEDDRYEEDQAALNILKQNTPLSSVPLKVEDFDFGEERSNSIQILKNVKNTDNAYYIVLAVHGDTLKRDDFVKKVIASGYSDVNFFYDINTSNYYIYSDKTSSLQAANKKLENMNNTPYTSRMSIIKIEN
ncbi:PorP/SprF family type IX secretion system membrane protein [uncultured Dokdonia sp.]|uniref:PorP/SprF family type IX secretion system membrane protein n=1 Tax=uncultured Dokdonia sp. TaxID=575653 RepID=UPI00262317E2|nr:PorP/SprF family type IX secretion system membrane protein [uncultured Dokdonia sp.]